MFVHLPQLVDHVSWDCLSQPAGRLLRRQRGLLGRDFVAHLPARQPDPNRRSMAPSLAHNTAIG
jgi:hypothetical protein